MDHRVLFALGVVPLILAFTARSGASAIGMVLMALAAFGLAWYQMDGCVGGWFQGMPRLCRTW